MLDGNGKYMRQVNQVLARERKKAEFSKPAKSWQGSKTDLVF